MAAKTVGYRVFRVLTPARLRSVQALITAMKQGKAGTTTIVETGRLAYGLTQQAVDIMVDMRINKGKTRADIGYWLEARLTTAQAEQARTTIKPGRTVDFR